MSAPSSSPITSSRRELAQRPFRLTWRFRRGLYLADTLIIATGARRDGWACRREEKFQGFGVSACATCDGFFYRGKEVRGGRRRQHRGRGGAVPHQLRLQGHARASPRHSCAPSASCRSGCSSIPRSKVVWDSAVEEILGTDDPPGVTGVRLKNVKTGATQPNLPPTASSSPSATRRRRSCSRAS